MDTEKAEALRLEELAQGPSSGLSVDSVVNKKAEKRVRLKLDLVLLPLLSLSIFFGYLVSTTRRHQLESDLV